MTLRRKTPMRRSGSLTRKARGRSRNPERAAASFLRCYGSEERVRWVRHQPCVVRGCNSPRGAQQNMHTRGDGLARKGDADTVIPCCPAHHQESHNIGLASWAVKYRLNPTQLAVDTEVAWQRYMAEDRAFWTPDGAA